MLQAWSSEFLIAPFDGGTEAEHNAAATECTGGCSEAAEHHRPLKLHRIGRHIPSFISEFPLRVRNRAARVVARTLHRRLGDEQTSFAEVLADARHQRALQLLRDPGLAVYQVAHLLGYSENAAFTRAFRRWTGEAPESWRDRNTSKSATEPQRGCRR